MKLAIAAAIAAGIGLFLKSDTGEEIKEEVMERGKKVAKKFNKTRKQVQGVVQEAFGEVRDDLEEGYVHLQGELLADVDALKDKAALKKREYEEMVDEAVERYGKDRKWTSNALTHLKKDLKEDWVNLKEDLAKDAA